MAALSGEDEDGGAAVDFVGGAGDEACQFQRIDQRGDVARGDVHAFGQRALGQVYSSAQLSDHPGARFGEVALGEAVVHVARHKRGDAQELRQGITA